MLLLYSPEKVDKQTVMGIEELLLCVCLPQQSSLDSRLLFATNPKQFVRPQRRRRRPMIAWARRGGGGGATWWIHSLSLSLSLSLSRKHPLQNIKSFQIHSITFSSTKNIHLVAQYQSKDFHRVCVPACKKKISITKECYNRTRISCKMTGRKKTTQAGNSS